MPIKYILIIIALGLFIASCESIEESYVFESNGSGQSSFSITMSDFGGLSEMYGTETEGFGDDMFSMSSDTIFRLYETVPDSILAEMSNAELLKNMYIRINTDSSTQSMTFGVDVAFSSTEDLKKTYALLGTLDSLERASGEQGEFGAIESFQTPDIQWEPGLISLGRKDFSDPALFSEMMGQDSVEDFDAEEMMGMLEMFMGSLEYSLTVKAPGDIYKCECGDAVVDKSTMRHTFTLMDALRDTTIYPSVMKIYYRE